MDHVAPPERPFMGSRQIDLFRPQPLRSKPSGELIACVKPRILSAAIHLDKFDFHALAIPVRDRKIFIVILAKSGAAESRHVAGLWVH